MSTEKESPKQQVAIEAEACTEAEEVKAKAGKGRCTITEVKAEATAEESQKVATEAIGLASGRFAKSTAIGIAVNEGDGAVSTHL